MKLTAAICGLAALIALGIVLALLYQPITRPALAVIGDPLYRDLQIPPNAGADQGNHIDLIRLKEDAGYLFAPVAEPSLQDWNLLTADRLLRESQDRLTEISRALPSDDRTIVVYCGLLGLSRNGKAMLLVSDASGTDREIPASEWIHGLSSAAEEADARVLVLLDPGPATVSWRQGILAPDFVAQLESELAAKPVKNLCVILASGPGETSWRITDVPAPSPPTEEKREAADSAPADPADPHGLGRSIFSYYVVSGLRGESTDRSGRATRTADDKPYGNSDGRITANELFTYVSQKVDRWATSERGARQTVTKFGGDGNFLVGAVTKRPPEPKPGEQANAETPQSAKDNKKAKAPKEPPAVAAERRLAKLWEHRDQLAESSPPGYAISPVAWRELQSRLLAAEQRLRTGLVDAAVKLMDEAEGQIATIASTADEMNLATRFGGTWLRPFLPTIPVRTASKPAASGAGDSTAAGTTPAPAPPDVAALLDEAAKTPPTMPLPNEQAIRERLADREALAKALDWVVGKGSTARSSADWAALDRVVTLLPAGELSPELRTVQRLVAASKAWTGSAPDKMALLAASVLRMFDRFGRVGLDDPASLATCRHLLAEGLLATAAAERWLVLAGNSAEAERHLRRAETALRSLEQATAAVSNARRLQQRLNVQLPELATWLASVREREPKLSAEDDRYSRVEALSADLNALASDAVSSESDWGRLQSRIDAAWMSANIDDASGIGADLTTLSFGERRLAALLRTLDESGPEAGNRDAINARLRETVAALEALPLGVSDAISKLVLEPDWSDIDTQLHFASLPGLDAARRQQLRLALQNGEYSRSNGTLSGESRRWEAGTWHGFWSQQVLKPVDAAKPSNELESERSARFDRAWKEFLEDALDAEGSQIALRRASLGAGIRGLTEIEPRFNSAASSTDAGSDVPTVLGLFADVNLLSGDPVDLRKAWSTLPIKGRPTATVDEQLIAREIGAALVDAESIVASDGPRGARLALRSFPQRGHLALRTGDASNPIDVYVGADSKPTGELPADAVNPTPTVQFRDDLTGDESVIVALIDQDQFPVAIQRIRVVPEVGEERWRIRFAASANRTEVLSDAPEVLSLPPRTDKPLEIVPVLEYPAAAPTEVVSVEVQQRDDPVSDNWRTVLGPKTFPLRENSDRSPTGDLRRLVLDFTPAPTTPADPAGPPAATANAGTTFSFENGLRFLVRLDGKELPPREIWPVTFDAGRFISEDAKALGVRLEGTPPRIEALITATTGVDPRIPETVPVELHFDRALDPLVGDQKATKGFVAPGSGGTLRLFGQISDGAGFEQLLNSSTGGTVALSVAGLPRAYRWRLRAGQEPDRIQPTDSPLELEFVRKTAPPNAPPAAGAPAALPAIEAVPVNPTLNAAMIDPTDLPNVSLRYFVYQQFEDQRAARTLNIRLTEPGMRQKSQDLGSEQIVRRFATRMNAAVTGAVWNVSVESEPHAVPLFKNSKAVGRFEVTTVLRTPGIDDADAASKTIRLVIDGTAPATPKFLSPNPNNPVPADRPLPVVYTTSDPESGVHSVELRVDVNANGTFEAEQDAAKVFGESDLAADAVGDPWYRDGKVEVRWNVPVQLIPAVPKEGNLDRVTIWAVATNRSGLSVETPLRLELKRAKAKPPPPPPTTGDIVVTVTPKPRPPVPPEIVLVSPDGGTEKRSGTNATFSKLKPGQYEIRVTQGTTGFKGQGAAKVTVEAGKKSSVQIKVE